MNGQTDLISSSREMAFSGSTHIPWIRVGAMVLHPPSPPQTTCLDSFWVVIRYAFLNVNNQWCAPGVSPPAAVLPWVLGLTGTLCWVCALPSRPWGLCVWTLCCLSGYSSILHTMDNNGLLGLNLGLLCQCETHPATAGMIS